MEIYKFYNFYGLLVYKLKWRICMNNLEQETIFCQFFQEERTLKHYFTVEVRFLELGKEKMKVFNQKNKTGRGKIGKDRS